MTAHALIMKRVHQRFFIALVLLLGIGENKFVFLILGMAEIAPLRFQGLGVFLMVKLYRCPL